MNKFSIGVLDVFYLKESEDIVIVGDLDGVINKGDIAYITNYGDNKHEKNITKILGIDIRNKFVYTAKDCRLGIKIENAKNLNIKAGTVIYSENTTIEEIRNSYINSLGNYYVAKRRINLTDDELEKLNVTDCIEILNLFNSHINNIKENKTDEQRKTDKKNSERMAEAIAKKIINEDEIYCIYSRITGEPALYSYTLKKNEVYICTPPDIRVFTKAYVENTKFPDLNNKIELKCIKNNEARNEINNFFEYTFNINGACGIQFIYKDIAIDSKMFSSKIPDTNLAPFHTKENLKNPNLVKWLLLLNQIKDEKGEDYELIYKLYYQKMLQEITKAVFLIPIDKNNVNIQKIEGKNNKQAIPIYTDLKHLRMMYDNECDTSIKPIEEIIEDYDCAINMTQKNVCYYISKDMLPPKNVNGKNETNTYEIIEENNSYEIIKENNSNLNSTKTNGSNVKRNAEEILKYNVKWTKYFILTLLLGALISLLFLEVSDGLSILLTFTCVGWSLFLVIIDVVGRLKRKITLKKYDINEITKDLQSQNTVKVYGIETYLTDNYIISNLQNLKINRYDEIVWLYLEDRTVYWYSPTTYGRYRSTRMTFYPCLIAYLKNGKKVDVSIIKNNNQMNTIIAHIQHKNINVLVGNTVENRKKYEEIYAELNPNYEI